MKYILIVVVLAAIVGGGILGYQYWWAAKKETTPPEVKAPEEVVITKPELNLKSTKLATIPEEYIDKSHSFTFSPTGNQVAYITSKGEGCLVVIGNNEGKLYDEVGYPVFSYDGKKVAYGAKEGKKMLLIIGDEGGQTYNIPILTITDEVQELLFSPVSIDPVFSPDGKNIAYQTMKDLKWVVVVRDIDKKTQKEGKAYDSIIREIQFSPDGRVAYIATENDKSFVVVGEKEEKSYPIVYKTGGGTYGVSIISFSPDGKQIAYTVGDGKKDFVVVGGQEGKAYDNVGGSIFSFDGKHILYVAKQGDKWFIVLDGKEIKLYENVREIEPIAFSPDGKQIGYVVKKKDGETFVVVGEKTYKSYKPSITEYFVFIMGPYISPDNKKVAYLVYGGKEFVVVNEKELQKHDSIGWGVYFSPDSKYLAYGALDANELWWVVEEVE